jgi:hypothetical protein
MRSANTIIDGPAAMPSILARPKFRSLRNTLNCLKASRGGRQAGRGRLCGGLTTVAQRRAADSSPVQRGGSGGTSNVISSHPCAAECAANRAIPQRLNRKALSSSLNQEVNMPETASSPILAVDHLHHVGADRNTAKRRFSLSLGTSRPRLPKFSQPIEGQFSESIHAR